VSRDSGFGVQGKGCKVSPWRAFYSWRICRSSQHRWGHPFVREQTTAGQWDQTRFRV